MERRREGGREIQEVQGGKYRRYRDGEKEGKDERCRAPQFAGRRLLPATCQPFSHPITVTIIIYSFSTLPLP